MMDLDNITNFVVFSWWMAHSPLGSHKVNSRKSKLGLPNQSGLIWEYIPEIKVTPTYLLFSNFDEMLLVPKLKQ